MSLEIEKVSYDPAKTDMAGIRFTQSKSGHVHSPWFTYDYEKDLEEGKIVYGFGNKTAEIMRAAAKAFAAILDISVETVIVTENKNSRDGEIQWRLGTMGRCYLPVSKLKKAPSEIRKLEEPYLDIDTRPVEEMKRVGPSKRKRLK